MESTVKKLRAFFTVSNAAFELVESTYESSREFNSGLEELPPQRKLTKEVHALHKDALKELQNGTQDLSVVDGIMFEVERIVQREALEKQNAIHQKFKPGGLSFNPGKENEK